jgi:hypothetical protein
MENSVLARFGLRSNSVGRCPFHERVNREKSYLAIDAYNSKAGIGSVWGR